MDLYPREGKYDHAAAFSLKDTYMIGGKRSIPVSAMVCNFTRPTKNKPSLLTFGEVLTFFHELGHIFHQLLSKVRFSIFSGTSVELDFVESPSQALENWCYEEDFLKRISSHYKTKKSMPKELMKKIKENKHLFQGLSYIRQLVFCYYDLLLHEGGTVDVEKSFMKLLKELNPLKPGKESNPSNFEHIMGGYEAGYYSYIWSEVYAAEIFDLFKSSGDLFNKKIGKKYRKAVLEKGGTESGMDMMEALLGRKPNNKLFMKQLDL